MDFTALPGLATDQGDRLWYFPTCAPGLALVGLGDVGGTPRSDNGPMRPIQPQSESGRYTVRAATDAKATPSQQFKIWTAEAVHRRHLLVSEEAAATSRSGYRLRAGAKA